MIMSKVDHHWNGKCHDLLFYRLYNMSSKGRKLEVLNENKITLRINIKFLPPLESPNDCFIEIKWPVGCSKN